MMGVGDLFSIYYIALAFAGVLAILWVVFEFSEKKPEKPGEKSAIFACGMKASPEELNVPPWNYYEYLKRFFRAERLSEMHSGELSHYIAWILMGIALILSVMLILW